MKRGAGEKTSLEARGGQFEFMKERRGRAGAEIWDGGMMDRLGDRVEERREQWRA